MIQLCRLTLLSAVMAIAISKSYKYVAEFETDDAGRSMLTKWEPLDEAPVRCVDDGFDVFSDAFKTIGGDIIDVSTRGKEVWVAKKDGSIHRFKNNQWKQMPGGAAISIAAAADGWAWVCNSAYGIWRFNPATEAWESIYGGLRQVSAFSKLSAVGVNPGKYAYVWKDEKWTQLPPSQPGAAGQADGLPNGGVWTSIGQQDERWAVGPFEGIWRWDHPTGKWIEQPGKANTIDVHSPSRIVITDKDNKVFKWMPAEKKWQQLVGKVAKRATIGDRIVVTLNPTGFLEVMSM